MKEVVVGIDIGGTNTIFGLVDKSGNVIAESRLLTTEYPEVKKFISVLIEAINRLMEGKAELKLTGIGIGAPNANYHKGTIELAPNLPWKGIIPLAEYMKRKAGVQVAVTNDENAAVLGTASLAWNELK